MFHHWHSRTGRQQQYNPATRWWKWNYSFYNFIFCAYFMFPEGERKPSFYRHTDSVLSPISILNKSLCRFVLNVYWEMTTSVMLSIGFIRNANISFTGFCFLLKLINFITPSYLKHIKSFLEQIQMKNKIYKRHFFFIKACQQRSFALRACNKPLHFTPLLKKWNKYKFNVSSIKFDQEKLCQSLL